MWGQVMKSWTSGRSVCALIQLVTSSTITINNQLILMTSYNYYFVGNLDFPLYENMNLYFTILLKT